MSFNTPLDIGNRALQLVGASRISSFSENSLAAAEVSFCYDKLRRAELERNIWAFCISRAWLYPVGQTTMEMVPVVWDPSVVYQMGSVATYTDSYGTTQTWVSQGRNNLNKQPDQSPTYWQPYFGPPLINQFIPQSTGTTPLAYNIGDVVYMPIAPGRNQAFLSLINGNTEVPNVPDQWVAYVSPFVNDVLQPQQLNAESEIIGQYAYGDIVQGSDGFFYMSLIDINQNNDPTSGPFPWNEFTTYAANALVAGLDGFQYISLTNSNLGNDPLTDTTHWQNYSQYVAWTPCYEGGVGSNAWLQLDVTLQVPNIVYPIGAGPVEQYFTRNIFPLPNNFLRRAPQDPTAGARTFLGSPTGLALDDYVIENGYLTSRSPFPIPLRYCSDKTNVAEWPAMFAEGVAARVASEICERVTQSGEKLKEIGQNYGHFMTEARLVGMILTGETQLPEDDYIVTRL